MPSVHGHVQLNPGPRKNEPEIVSTPEPIRNIVNIMYANFRLSGRIDGLRSRYGSATRPKGPQTSGNITPDTMGCQYRSISCRPRKYHGAFDGLGVTLGLASSRNGAGASAENTVRNTVTTIRATNSAMSRCGQV